MAFTLYDLNWVCYFRQSYFFIIIKKVINKSPSHNAFETSAWTTEVGNYIYKASSKQGI